MTLWTSRGSLMGSTVIFLGVLTAAEAVHASEAFVSQVAIQPFHLPAHLAVLEAKLVAQSAAAFKSVQSSKILAVPIPFTASQTMPINSSNVSAGLPTVPASGNSALIFQAGSNNTATLIQAGIGNAAIISQQGHGNIAMVSQSTRAR
jgi:hypothetical protein